MRDTRNPLLVVALSFVTLGFYMVYWHFQVSKEIRSFGGDPATPWLQFIPLANLYFFYSFTKEAVASLPSMNHSWLHIVFHIFFPYISVALIQHRINEYYNQDVQTEDGTVTLERVVDIVDEAIGRGHDQDYVTKRLREKGVSDHYINEAYRIENKRNGYY